MKTRIEHDAYDADAGAPRFIVETRDDYELVRARIAALEEATRGAEEERELAALRLAALAWERQPH